jgi:hypothetical protein
MAEEKADFKGRTVTLVASFEAGGRLSTAGARGIALFLQRQ